MCLSFFFTNAEGNIFIEPIKYNRKNDKFKMHFIILEATKATGKFKSDHGLPFNAKEAQDRGTLLLMLMKINTLFIYVLSSCGYLNLYI